jgi:hypothetical protein
VVTNFINNGNIQFVTDGYNFNSFETGAIDNAGYINTLTNAVNGNIIGPRGISNQGPCITSQYGYLLLKH